MTPACITGSFKSTHCYCIRNDWSLAWLDDHVKQLLKLLLDPSLRNRLFKSSHCYCTR